MTRSPFQHIVCDECKIESDIVSTYIYPHSAGWINVVSLLLGEQRGMNMFQLQKGDYCSYKCLIQAIENIHKHLLDDLKK